MEGLDGEAVEEAEVAEVAEVVDVEGGAEAGEDGRVHKTLIYSKGLTDTKHLN